MFRSSQYRMALPVVIFFVLSMLDLHSVHAQTNLREPNCENPTPQEMGCCLGGNAQVCAVLGFKPPAVVTVDPGEAKRLEIGEQCAQFAEDMGWHQSDLEKELAANSCRRNSDKFLGTDPKQALHGIRNSSGLNCHNGYMAKEGDCVRLPEMEGGLWNGTTLKCTGHLGYVRVIEKRGVATAADTRDLTPEQQRCWKTPPKQTTFSGQDLTSDKLLNSVFGKSCPGGYAFVKTARSCVLQ